MTRPTDIDPFQEYVDRGNVREMSPDPSQASNLMASAKRKFENMERLGLSEKTATDYLENTYEAVKMLVQAFMALDGYNPYSHEAIIAYGLDHLDLTAEEANRFNKFRKLRNDISYRGDMATIDEAREVRDLFEQLSDRLEPRLEEKLP